MEDLTEHDMTEASTSERLMQRETEMNRQRGDQEI